MHQHHDEPAPALVRRLPEKTGVLLVGHGTRDALGRAEFHQAAEMLRRRLPGAVVEACCLELASPDVHAGVAALGDAGVRRMVAAPLLLFAAGHAKEDIPAAIAEAARWHEGLTWRMADPLGDHPALIHLSARRFREALGGATAPAGMDDEVTLLFVGRGASDAQAIEQVRRFAAARRELTPVAAQRVCFLAAAEPSLDEAIRWATAQSPKCIVVQPHLLFHGRLIQDIAAKIERAKRQTEPGGPLKSPPKSWRIARHLGPAPAVIDALMDRVFAAAAPMS